MIRLNVEQTSIIKEVTKEIFGESTKVYLFGSRTDINKKGGDIDLYLETDCKEFIFDKKIKMLMTLKKQLGEQKIDIVINNFTKIEPIYEFAKEEGVLL